MNVNRRPMRTVCFGAGGDSGEIIDHTGHSHRSEIPTPRTFGDAAHEILAMLVRIVADLITGRGETAGAFPGRAALLRLVVSHSACRSLLAGDSVCLCGSRSSIREVQNREPAGRRPVTLRLPLDGLGILSLSNGEAAAT